MNRQVSLSDLFQIGSSKRVLKSQWQKSGVPFYRGREVTKLSQEGFVDNELFIDEELYQEYSEKYGTPRSGDIVITAIGTIGNSYVVNEGDRFYFKDASVLWLKRNSDVVSEYINYWLKSPLMREQLEEGNGATVDTLTIKKLQSLVVHLPSISEQKHIVAILDQAFADIDKARALTEQNLKNARELFEGYLQQVFSQRGEGWVNKRLHEICSFSSGGTPSKKNDGYWEGNIPWVSGRDMKSTQLSDSLLHISQAAVDESSTRMAPAGTILILVRGMGLAHGAQVAELLAPCAFNQDIRGLHPESGIVPRFLVFALRQRINSSDNILSNAAHGTLKINMDELKNIVISLPSKEQQKKIVGKFDLLIEQRRQLESIYKTKLKSLDELKKSLLQKAFSGELTRDSEEAAA